MKFRDYEVSKVMVVESASSEGLESMLEELMKNNNVIDLQYSTRFQTGIERISYVVWSALVLIGGQK